MSEVSKLISKNERSVKEVLKEVGCKKESEMINLVNSFKDEWSNDIGQGLGV